MRSSFIVPQLLELLIKRRSITSKTVDRGFTY